mgnify:CR=1 FL=1
MPKVKIGEKVVIGEEKKEERKRFTNGHKCFTSAETRALLELQTTERRAADNFEKKKYEIIRPRNPITGGVTPRTKTNLKGEILEKTGEPIFLHPPVNTKTPEEEEREAEERILQNKNPLKRSDKTEERIFSLQNRQDIMGGEIMYLRDLVEHKKKQLHQQTSRF